MPTYRSFLERTGLVSFAFLTWTAVQGTAFAQDLEPRRWSHLPVDSNVVGLTYVYTEGTIAFDPVLEITDAQMKVHTALASYTRAFDCLGKTGRFDLILPYQTASWDGLLSGAPASRQTDGLGDPWIRLSVDLVGAPALKGKEFQEFHGAHPINTVVGAALAVQCPLGEYDEDKLLNLGQNRFVIRPQAGILHTRGRWSYELSSSVFLFADNDEFFGGSKREQDPLYAFQAHVIHTFDSRWWASVSTGYSWGGESTINGTPKDDGRRDLLSSVATGLPVGQTQSLKLVYVRGDTQVRAGSETNSLLLSWAMRF